MSYVAGCESSVRPISLQIRIPGKSLKLALIQLLQLRTAQLDQGIPQSINNLAHGTSHILYKPFQQIRRLQNGSLEREASSIVAFEQVLGVVDSACQVFKIDTREGVGRAGVATDVEELRVFEGNGVEIEGEEGDGVFVADGAFVWSRYVSEAQ
jgi:hypothetical protein